MVELRIIGEGQAWHNFTLANIDKMQSPTITDVNDILKPYNGRIIDHKTWTLTFNTEQDKAFFILKWA